MQKLPVLNNHRIALVAALTALTGCDDYRTALPQAVEDIVIVPASSTRLIDVKANDIAATPESTIQLLGNPLVGHAWVERSNIRYIAPHIPGRDIFVYELEVEGHRSVTLVNILVLPQDDPAVTSNPGVEILRQTVPAQNIDRISYTPVDRARPDIEALVPLASEILKAYGNPISSLDRARAIRDWVARTAIHPYPPFHPDDSIANLAVLPAGTSWADVNRLQLTDKVESDSRYWSEVHLNGYAMLDRLLGTLNQATGVRANDGLMEQVGVAHYRIRDVAHYKYVLCSYQDVIAIALWGAIGLEGMLLSTDGHDPAAVFIPELGKWVYQDPTYNEEFLLEGTTGVRSPLELLALSLAGAKDLLVSHKLRGPIWSPDIYIDARVDPRATYFGDNHPNGMTRMGSQLNNDSPTTPGFLTRLVQVRVPVLEWPFNDETKYVQVDPSTAFPHLGARITFVAANENHIQLGLDTTHPHYNLLQRRIDNGDWEPVSQKDVLRRSQIRQDGSVVRYRSLDSHGALGMSVSAFVAFSMLEITRRDSHP